MFDIAPSEFLLVAFVALVVIGPKDLPKAMRVVGYWVGKARGVARQFRSGFDSMVREAELEEMEKRWASENERIMREHPPTAPSDASQPDLSQSDGSQSNGPADTAQIVHSPETEMQPDDHTAEPVMVEKPVVAAADTKPVSSEPIQSAHQTTVQEAKSATDRSPDLFDASATSSSDDKTGKPDVASS